MIRVDEGLVTQGASVYPVGLLKIVEDFPTLGAGVDIGRVTRQFPRIGAGADQKLEHVCLFIQDSVMNAFFIVEDAVDHLSSPILDRRRDFIEDKELGTF